MLVAISLQRSRVFCSWVVMSPLCFSVIRRASVATCDLQCILCGPRTRVRRGLQHPKFRVCYHYWNAKALHMLNFVQIFVMSCKTVEIHGPQVHRAVYCEECVVSRASFTGWQSGTLENSQCGHRERTMRREADWDGFCCIREDLLSVLLKFMWSCFVCTYFSFLTPRPCV